MEDEIWRDVEGYEGFYQVSSKGRVRSLDRMRRARGGKTQICRGRVLSMKCAVGAGYLVVGLSRDGKVETKYIHHLVLEAFVGPCPEGMEARHYPDDDKTNNCIENLSWSTHKENCADRREHGTDTKGYKHTDKTRKFFRELRKKDRVFKGTKNPKAKLTENQVLKIIELSDWVPVSVLAEKYKVSSSSIENIVKGITWKHLQRKEMMNGN